MRHIPTLALFLALMCCNAWSADGAATQDPCARPPPGAELPQPQDLRSQNGVLKVDMTIRSYMADGKSRYCYLVGDNGVSPTLRLHPGDLLVLSLKNKLKPESAPARSAHQHSGSPSDPCSSGTMSLTSTNLHFHGLYVPPLCHQDDVLKTSIQPTDPPFEYRFRIPVDEPPGLYWYHPHIHGFSAKQVSGGASGALIVEGVEHATPQLAGLPERVIVIRDQELLNPAAAPAASDAATTMFIDRDGDAVNTGTGFGQPAKDLSVNFVPVPYPDYPPATVTIKPGERQLWRVLNASSVTYLNLAMIFKRDHWRRAQLLGVVAVDGVPLNSGADPEHPIQWRDGIVVPPGARVEFIMNGPGAGVSAELITRAVDTGEAGENDPNRALISIHTSIDAAEPNSTLPSAVAAAPPPPRAWLGSVEPARVRKLYFSEDSPDPAHPGADVKFYLTVDGQARVPFDPSSSEPNIVVKQGDVEDWIIENRSTELHAFHIHQIHFQIVEWLGMPVNEPLLRDTINVPYYNAKMAAYPTIKLRMDFRDPNTVGTFVYHCHLLDHEDAGMMGLIRVDPR
jgi:FtsP/CotA-like multicopper oxidase with cupredoxin domain